MRTPTTLLALAILATTGCSPAALQALSSAAAAANATNGTAAAGAPAATGTTPTTPAASTPSGTASPAPTAKPGAPAMDTKDKDFAAFKAKLDAASDDPRAVAKLFVAAFAHYQEDKAFAFELMTAAAADSEVQDDATSRSGKKFIQAREIYWRGVDRQPDLAKVYFDQPENMLAADAEAHVVIDDEYKAANKGVNGDTAYFYLKVAGPSGKSSRPVGLHKQANGWRVNSFSSIVVEI